MMQRPSQSLLRSACTTGARLLAIASLVVILALASRRLGSEEFGFFSILLAVMNFAMALDAGFRFGLGNRLAALSADPRNAVTAKRTFWAVFHFECLLGVLGASVCFMVFPHLDWASLFKIHSPALLAEASWLFPLVCGLFLLNQPFTLAGTVLFANHHIILSSALAAVQSLLLVVSFMAGLWMPTFGRLCLVFFGAYLLGGIAATLFVVMWKRWAWEWVDWREQWAAIRSLATTSMEFSWLNMSALAVSLIGPFLAGTLGGLKTAGDFALLQRIFNLLVASHLAMLSPLAPVYTRDAMRGEWRLIQGMLRRCTHQVLPAVFLGGGALLAVAHPWVLFLWTGRWIFDYGLAALLAAGALLAGWANTYSVLLNSLGVVRRQAALSVTMLVPMVALPILMGRHLGVYGIAGAAVCCTLPGVFLGMRWAHESLDTERLHA